MKLGVFDSGLGGLLMSKAIRQAIPDIDMVYFGDTLHVPYGNRSAEVIYDFTVQAVEFLFAQGCPLVVIACNTASVTALRRLQQEWLPVHYPDRRVLGVVVPVLEKASVRGDKNIGLMATNYVIHSRVYEEELRKIDGDIALYPVATPLLVPLIENDGWEWVDPVLEKYLADVRLRALDSMIVGCTHYPLVRAQIQKHLPGVHLICQDDIIPERLVDYLRRHPEIDGRIGRSGLSEFFVSDITPAYCRTALAIYGEELPLLKAGHSDGGKRAA